MVEYPQATPSGVRHFADGVIARHSINLCSTEAISNNISLNTLEKSLCYEFQSILYGELVSRQRNRVWLFNNKRRDSVGSIKHWWNILQSFDGIFPSQ